MEDIDEWVAEFFIFRQRNPRISPTNLLSLLKLKDSPDNTKLKTFSVLRDISNSLIRGTIDEGTLDLLELLEKLHSPLLTESHKSAYCWTAAECTVKFMWPLRVSDSLLNDAVERIWGKRIGVLKGSGSGLVTQELLKWEDDVKMAVEDDRVYQRIRESNVRYKAVSFLTQLIKEQGGLLGSSALESVARRRFLKRKAESDIPRDGDESTERLESDGFDKVNGGEEERTQEQEHESSLDKGDKRVARELKECLLMIQRQIDPSTSHVHEPNSPMTPRPTRFNRTGTTSGQGNASEKGSGSQDTYSGRVRPHLPTPEPLNVSPLRKVEPAVRRRKKFWTPEEEAALREGVKEYGKSWKEIKNANPAVFAERTEVDLKDKWRNLTR
ncbi:unnamed protein product [Eruca vesicaria subsp. sativa]|uniref:Uncharacterized protein n=1 Tax=Eruca vesicaria subsp. sativa TaxID=29727 RepID=A0ABC8KZV5_ERUVS|nr:unnamed protein product [Eruca vesicaria subsp. sativa]